MQTEYPAWKLVCCATLTVAFVPACGPQRPTITPASGRVLMNGHPLTGVDGFVRVEPAGARAATGAIDRETGAFSLTTFARNDGCVAGTHPVAVVANVTVGGRLVSLIPEKYADSATSGLTVAVAGRTADLTIALEGEIKPAPQPSEADLKNDTPGF